MRFSARSKVGVLLSLVTILTLVSAFAVTIVSRGSATHASSSNTSGQFLTLPGHSINALGFTSGSGKSLSSSPAKNLPVRNMRTFTPGHAGLSSQSSSAVRPATVSPIATDDENLLHNFNGLSNLDNAILNPFTAEPPDQGLCAGYLTDQATGQKIAMEYEMVNDVIAIYLPTGKFVIAQSLLTFFGESNFSNNGNLLVGDPRCFFDRTTDTFFFTATVIGPDQFLPPTSQSHIDLAVINADEQKGAEYLLDTTDLSNSNCPCFADYPTFGFDKNAVYIGYNEGNIPTGTSNPVFQGAKLFAFPKNKLVAQQHTNIQGYQFPPFGPDVFTIQPAINVGNANSEYLENSFALVGSSNALELWHVTNDQNVGTVAPTITHKVITVQNYEQPVAATSTGNGSITPPFISAPTLNPDDDSLQQVEAIQDEGRIELWSALDTGVSITGDSQTRDGIAWFRIDAASANVVEQATQVSPGNYLLYPAILHSNNGTTAIVFTITSAKINPSAAYMLSPSSPTKFGLINIVATGAGAYLTEFNRWGDYSAAALALNGEDIWLGTEYVPPVGTTTFGANWGTEVFEVSNNN